MNIKEIFLYSHKGELRRVSFKVHGLNIITGRSSTGKSAISEIVEYCMGRSDFNIPEGPIRDKVAWYGVIYQFKGEQVMIAKPAPAQTASSCSRVMLRRGADLQPPDFTELRQNTDDDSVVELLSELLGIPANRTVVPDGQSRSAFVASIRHAVYYLFQKQGIIANKEQLFYRQNEPFIPQAIKDTLPILLGVAPDDSLDLDAKLRSTRRELKLIQKQLADAEYFGEQLNVRALGLVTEAQQVGVIARGALSQTTEEILELLDASKDWKPITIPDEDTAKIAELEDEILALRRRRSESAEILRATRLFTEKEDGFTTEVNEQKSRLESIGALPSDPVSGEWQWPFAPENLGMDTPVAKCLMEELDSLSQELDSVVGERPHLEEYTLRLEGEAKVMNELLRSKEEQLASAIAANSAIAEMGSRNAAAARVMGRISLFLENHVPDDEIPGLRAKVEELIRQVAQLEKESNDSDRDERLASILNIISNRIRPYVSELEAEFSEFDFRFDFNHLTVVADRPERPVPMSKTGGGANHLAYHLGALLALHHFTTNNGKPMPSFLFLDQPTQVYFPSEQIYKAASEIEDTERDADLNQVRKLFEMLYRFATVEAIGIQIIVTEHANLRDQWFQDSIIETPWTKPPALVPEEWESNI